MQVIARSLWLVPMPYLKCVRTIFSDISKISFQFNWFNLHVIALAVAQFKKEIVLFASILKGLGNIYKQTS